MPNETDVPIIALNHPRYRPEGFETRLTCQFCEKAFPCHLSTKLTVDALIKKGRLHFVLCWQCLHQVAGKTAEGLPIQGMKASHGLDVESP